MILNVEVSAEQEHILKPTTLDTVAGFLMKDLMGEGSKKRLPQCRLNFIDSQVSSHCSVLDSDEWMKLIQISNQVAAVLADIHNDRQKTREKSRVQKEQEEAKKEQRRIA